MPSYDVNVRAIVRATALTDDASGDVPGWEIYDAARGDARGEVVLRCDRNVTVEAGDEAAAIERAKEDAPAIAVEGHEIDSVELWVDESIDVEPSPSAPGPR